MTWLTSPGNDSECPSIWSWRSQSDDSFTCKQTLTLLAIWYIIPPTYYTEDGPELVYSNCCMFSLVKNIPCSAQHRLDTKRNTRIYICRSPINNSMDRYGISFHIGLINFAYRLHYISPPGGGSLILLIAGFLVSIVFLTHVLGMYLIIISRSRLN
jgi:hypothetical protein